ncbi:phosphoribosylformylglycinamidine synthase subunit PurL [bacterium]|nr:phosphoribosylformylglycinamidine synthase subunit PurL [bacterium]
MEITDALIREHGLSREEYDRILEILGRVPTYTELGIYSVMWSEHCSYKSSISLLKTLLTEGRYILTKAGEENAGAIDIGDGYAIVFKIESHNHPSAIEPFQGAATGVGGILRDIFAMGARPIAMFDPLRFGPLSDRKSRHLFDGVVKGISAYGNCFGVPTVGGEAVFEDVYAVNPLVNVMAVGLIRHEKLTFAKATGSGNPVMIVGGATGRDGIHGATFASDELTDKSAEDRPSVQIGDPFMEKLLMEATLEVIDQGLVVGIQDMGAAGITCSTCETAAKEGSGMEVDLELIPKREEGMIPYEILLSETQERMLYIIKKGKEDEVERILNKWGLHYAIVGKVTDDGFLKIRNGGETVARIPASSLVVGGGAPVCPRPFTRPSYQNQLQQFEPFSIPEPSDYNALTRELLSRPNIVSKHWIWEQYDQQVQTNTVVLPGSDAAVLRIKKTEKAVAVTTDGNGGYCYLEPLEGGRNVVAEAFRNIVSVGGKPAAITNCLNFGNPEDPEIYWYFENCVRGMNQACQHFGTPVTGGNVSFYNESPQGAVYPTPVIGMVGVIEKVEQVTTPWFKEKDHIIGMVGETGAEIGGSEYQKMMLNTIKGMPPASRLKEEQIIGDFCLEAIQTGLLESLHDLSRGGLLVGLLKCCLLDRENPVGANIEIDFPFRPDLFLCSESQARYIISLKPSQWDKLEALAQKRGVPCYKIGRTGGDRFKLNELINIPLNELQEIYYGTLPRLMKAK